MRCSFFLLILLLLASFSVAQAQALNLAELQIYNVWVRPTAAAPVEGATPEPPLPGTVTSAYMTIENTSNEDFQLVGIEAAFAEMSMIHETTLDDAGVARMRMIGALDIPAGETVQLAPAGYHAMLMNLTRDLYLGDTVALTLTIVNGDNTGMFNTVVGAVVTDTPPEVDSMIMTEAVAVLDEDGTLDLSLALDNRGDLEEQLVRVISLDGTEMLADAQTSFTPSIILLAGQETRLESGQELIRLTDFSQPPPDAFPIMLVFASGKILTVAVPILAGEAE